PVVHVIHSNSVDVTRLVTEPDHAYTDELPWVVRIRDHPSLIHRHEACSVEPSTLCPLFTRTRDAQVARRIEVRPHPKALRPEIPLSASKIAEIGPDEKLVCADGNTTAEGSDAIE